MKIPLFQILKDDEKGTVGASKAIGITEEDSMAMMLALLAAARADESLDNMIRVVANTRRHENPKSETDGVHLYMEVKDIMDKKKQNS